MEYPISIVVPRTPWGENVFLLKCLPSIRTNTPAEIIEEDGEEDLCSKRGKGVRKASQPYLMCVDENIILYEWTLKKMLQTLDEIKHVAFVYCDARVFSGRASAIREAKAWDPATIREGNYVGIATLMRREAFPLGADLKDAAGRDIWTAMADAGHQGLYISETLYEVHEA